jgi:dynein heavy chain 2
VKKVLELYELLRQRMGVVIVGPSGSGKSTLRKLLEVALYKFVLLLFFYYYYY